MRPHEHEAEAAAIIRHKTMARGAIACAWRFVRFKAAKAKRLGERGTALVEFGLLAPVLLLILLGTAQFGLTLNQYVMLTNAVGVGAMQFAISRVGHDALYRRRERDQSRGIDPDAGEPDDHLVGWQPTDGMRGPTHACATALTSNVGQPAQVSATYPCNLHVICGIILRRLAT